MNIFTTENISKYAKSGYTTGIGEWVQRNGIWSMAINPSRFWDTTNKTFLRVLANEFIENTQYVVNIYVDVDDNTSYGGIRVYYTDNTYVNLSATTDESGFQFKYLVTDSSKSVRNIAINYNNAVNSYYRWDSYIMPFSSLSITKQNQLLSGNLIEDQNTVSFHKGGSIHIDNFYEI